VLGANAVVRVGAHRRADVDLLVDIFDLAIVDIRRVFVLHVHRASGREAHRGQRRHERRVAVCLVRDDAAEWVGQVGD